ncbi:helix-turn-helix domain-containing protein [Achromobacter sp. CSND-B12]|uniref:helix-turn-helix domain-containing protein n=1 Tax=Achromobacter sp. CSND-B12 TaxID=3462570 RepID=UPI00406A39AA
MRLDQYLRAAKMTQSAFGEKLDPPVTQGTVSHWCQGRTRVSLAYSIQIERLTQGKVSPSDCAQMFEAECQRVLPRQALLPIGAPDA